MSACRVLAGFPTAALWLAGLAASAHGGLIIGIDKEKANSNGSLSIANDFTIPTSMDGKVKTSFTVGDKVFMGREVTQKNGPSIVAYDLKTFGVASGKTLTVTGAFPIAFLAPDDPATEFDVLIEGILSASADGMVPGPGGGAGGRPGRKGERATSAMTGEGMTGAGAGGGAGGGGGFGGQGGRGAVGGEGRGNRMGGAGGASYGDEMLSVLFGGGGGAGSTVPAGIPSAPGGGGGGGILISTDGKIKISGRIEADGFRGGIPGEGGLGGGGGAGGGIILSANVCLADSVLITGNVFARGGSGQADNVIASGGGGGGGGRVFISDPGADLSRVNVRAGSGGFYSPSGTGTEPEQGKAGFEGTKAKNTQQDACCVPEPSTVLMLITASLSLGVRTVFFCRPWAVRTQNRRSGTPSLLAASDEHR